MTDHTAITRQTLTAANQNAGGATSVDATLVDFARLMARAWTREQFAKASAR